MARLHILLDFEGLQNAQEDDIVLVTVRNKSSIPLATRIIYRDSWRGADSVDNCEYIKNTFLLLPEKYLACANTAYLRFYLPVYNVLQCIEQILADNIVDSLILYGGSMSCFLSATGAEGEGQRDNYQTNWLVNRFIYDKYYQRYSIVWIDKQSPLHILTKNLFRSTKRTIEFLFSELYESINDSSCRYMLNEGDFKSFSIVDLSQQYNNLNGLSDICGINNLKFFTRNKILSDVNKDVVYIPRISPLSVLGLWIKLVFRKRNSLPFYSVHSYRFKKELDFLLFQYMLFEKRLTRFFSKYNDMSGKELLTNMTFGFDIISCHSLTKFGVVHRNYQYVAMANVLYPNLLVADFYYLYSKKAYSFYNSFSPSFHFYFPIKSLESHRIHKQEILKITFFLQPDDIVYDYIDLMEACFPDLVDLKCEVFVKPHYRQNEMMRIKQICENYSNVTLYDLNTNINQVLGNTDVAICISSSVIFEAMSNNVMSLIFNPQNKYDKILSDYDICFPEVNFIFDKAEQLRVYIDNYSKYKDLFEKRLHQYIRTNESIVIN